MDLEEIVPAGLPFGAEDLDALQEAVWALWRLMPDSVREREQAIVAEAGIRRV